MTLMDGVQVAILLLLILLFLKSLWLPRRSTSLLMRLLPARALKSEGQWQRQSTKTDKHG
ncbi:cellulose biosynthesis protein BcsF [Pantoea dispersa]|uniref:cellulose biosynthesis protein BcsF n=1 Tax=Pantoea dispersa TaxID=59814 RepID=UPI0023A9B13F|nr:cellulose biosynthesis protein BcsF [Pantoea dispersa]WEA05587.1 cellulose biosynthesis protein BcsF [Pantoea dispersa]